MNYVYDETLNNTILRLIAFFSKSLSSAERLYSNIEKETLGICQVSKKFHHYHLSREVNVISDHKSLVAIFRKDVTMLSQQLQCILLRIHSYQTFILHKQGPGLHIVYWSTIQKQTEKKHKEIEGMKISLNIILCRLAYHHVCPFITYKKLKRNLHLEELKCLNKDAWLKMKRKMPRNELRLVIHR